MGDSQTSFGRFSAFSFFQNLIKPHFEIAKKKKKKRKEKKNRPQKALHDLTRRTRASRAAEQRENRVARPRTVRREEPGLV